MPTIYIYDEIGPAELGLVSAQAIANELDEISGSPQLIIRINSLGGMVTEAIAIRELLAEFSGPKVFKIDALAASAATILAGRGDEVQISASGRMVIHSPWTMAVGNAQDLRAQADTLDSFEDTLLDIYLERADLDRGDLRVMLQDETVLTAKEAVQLGFADSIMESSRQVAACWRPGVFTKTTDAILQDQPTKHPGQLARKHKAQKRIHSGPTAAQREKVRRASDPEFAKLFLIGK